MSIIDRDEAIRQKLKRYKTGRPCRRGHAAERYTLSGECVVCAIARQSAERQRIREAMNEAASC